MPAIADRIVSQLRHQGVRTLFGVPGGGGNLDLIEAARREGLPFVLTTTETGGAIAAIAQAEITGAPGACLTTLGPGAASVVNGVACAFLERASIFVFTDSGAATFPHQRIDQRALLRPISAFSDTLAGNVTRTLGEALLRSTARRGGPVHLDCPADFASLPAPDPMLVGEFDDDVLPPRDVRAKIEPILRPTRKPLLIAGLAARRPDDVTAIRDFCARRHVPVMVTYKAKGVVPDDDPWFAGVFTNAAIEAPMVHESDLIIAAGLDPVELLPRPWLYRQSVLQCGDTSPDGADQIPVATTLGWIRPSLEEIDLLLPPTSWNRDRPRQHVEAAKRAIDIAADGLTAQQVVRTAAARLAHDARVTVDAGAHMFAATMLWPVSEPNQMLISNGLSTMGFALPAAIGAGLLDRDRTVVALTGDGGLLMCMGELLTAVRERLKIIVIVFNDASLSLIEIKQQARKLAPAGVALGAMDWVAVARGFGMAGFVADNEETLDRAITSALGVPGPSVIEARIDRSNYGATMRAIRG